MTLLVVIAAIGHFNVRALYPRCAAVTGSSINKYGEYGKQLPSLQLLAERSSKQPGATEKRHKRPLIGKVFQPVVAFIFIKRFHLVERAGDYSSTHILQRPAIVFSLRGPPVHPLVIA